MKELKKIPPEFMCLSSDDMLRYAKINVLGVTVPQVYMKVKGNWTGGHQENLRVRATNINHGPDKSMWHCVGGEKQIERF
jgi:histone demethylase